MERTKRDYKSTKFFGLSRAQCGIESSVWREGATDSIFCGENNYFFEFSDACTDFVEPGSQPEPQGLAALRSLVQIWYAVLLFKLIIVTLLNSLFAIVDFQLFLIFPAILIMSGSDTDQVGYFLTINKKNQFITPLRVDILILSVLRLYWVFQSSNEERTLRIFFILIFIDGRQDWIPLSSASLSVTCRNVKFSQHLDSIWLLLSQ